LNITILTWRNRNITFRNFFLRGAWTVVFTVDLGELSVPAGEGFCFTFLKTGGGAMADNCNRKKS